MAVNAAIVLDKIVVEVENRCFVRDRASAALVVEWQGEEDEETNLKVAIPVA